MELKDNFRSTEIGVLPNDWEVITLGTIFEFKNGLNKEKKFFGQGTPIVNYMDVFKNNSLLASNLFGKVSVTSQEIKNYGVKKGDVFFTRTSETVEEIGISSVMLEDVKNAVFSGFVLRARPINEKLEDNFKRYCFSTREVRKEIISKSSYTTRALTNGRLLSSVKIVLPPIAEQTAIAAALSDMDALIALTEQLIQKKKDIKQGLMQQLLKPKEGWEIKRLGEIGEIITGGTPPTQIKEYWNGNIIWITPTDISSRKDIYVSERKITLKGLSVIRKLPKNSLLVTCIASIGKNAILKLDGACNQQINAIVPHINFNVEFIYYLIELQKNVLINKAGITATLILSKKEFSEIKFYFPTIEEQTRIAQILTDADHEITALEKQLKKLRHQKEGMMQVLLTGRIRFKID